MAIQFTAYAAPADAEFPRHIECIESVETHSSDAAALLAMAGLWDAGDPQGSLIGSCPVPEFLARLATGVPSLAGTDRFQLRLTELGHFLEDAVMVDHAIVQWS
ncbi:hypothetical protein [Actinomycetospora termitidis]|uniref:Uncharacterized protein n=1 Tax=Actinomycetospora termitidis TaxID=3053470 RepID=A0ABT7MJY4_9PSEU|nr:hypothetical protein [Actinomycetospora sp. Odt1-22]MDL5160499.1 hypothetical protein [Actinomycetospora sp. Odt1-22]